MSIFYNFIRESLLLAMIESAAENKSSVLNISSFNVKDFPLSLLHLKELRRLYLNNNSLKNLPDDMCDLKYLNVLTLDYNFLTSIPSDLGKLSNLVCLNLSHNNLGHLIPEIGQLHSLEVLWLNNTHLESLPPEIGNCTYLETLGARGNFIKELPLEIGKLKRLRWLTLEGNLLSVVPTEIDGMSSLVHLNLSNNQFERIPKIDELKALRFVFLNKNSITEIDMNLIETLTFVKTIDLRDNPTPSSSNYSHIRNLKFDTNYEFQVGNSSSEDSDSVDWEESLPSSDLNVSESSIEELPFEEILETALPQIARFASI